MPWAAVKSWMKLFGKRYSFIYYEGPDLDFNRNMIFRQAKRLNDDMLMIDSDIVFQEQDIEKIETYLKNGLDAISGVYVIGQPPYPPCIFERIPGDYKQCAIKKGLQKIDACGGGFMGISKKVIQAMPIDPFDNIREGNIFHGEDISFCHRMRESGFQLFCDSSIKVGHVRTQQIYPTTI